MSSLKAGELFAKIEALIPTMEGWTTPERAVELAAMVLALRPLVSVEIGVWGGRATIAMALAHLHIGYGGVIAIDPWSPAESVKGMTGEHAEWWAKVDHEGMYQYFKSKIVETGVSGQVTILRARSDDVSAPQSIDLLVIDGNHSDQAVRDTENFASKVRLGGICYIDDIAWEGGGVTKAVKLLNRYGFKEMYKRDTGAFFQRVKKAI